MPSKAPSTPASADDPAPSKSGITTDASGQRLIPASVRSDGSMRREIRIRPGYRPPEDVEVYKNRTAEAWRTRGSGGVPGAEPAAAEDEGAAKDGQGKSRNAKRRAAKRRAAEAAGNDGDNEEGGAAAGDKGKAAAAAATEETEAEADAREAKKLAKKLRQARELKDKKDKGAALLPEQFEKVIRISELIRQLEVLGFDADGERVSEAP
jgi:partner of Y14 and mago protein